MGLCWGTQGRVIHATHPISKDVRNISSESFMCRDNCHPYSNVSKYYGRNAGSRYHIADKSYIKRPRSDQHGNHDIQRVILRTSSSSTSQTDPLFISDYRPCVLKIAPTMKDTASTDSTQVDVLIVGAGPAGLMTANWMSRLGVKTRIIDKRGTKV